MKFDAVAKFNEFLDSVNWDKFYAEARKKKSAQSLIQLFERKPRIETIAVEDLKGWGSLILVIGNRVESFLSYMRSSCCHLFMLHNYKK